MSGDLGPLFNAEEIPFHLHSRRCGGSGAEIGVEDQVAWVAGDVEDAMYQAFRLRSVEDGLFGQERYQVLLAKSVVPTSSAIQSVEGAIPILASFRYSFNRGTAFPSCPK